PFRRASTKSCLARSVRFKGIDWQDVLYRLTLRARQLFVLARLKGYSAALALTGVTPEDLAQTVILEVLRDETVKFRPRGASAVTFLSRVLENDFKDLLRKGSHRKKVLRALDPAPDGDTDDPQYA